MFIKSLIRSNRIMAFSVISPCVIVKVVAQIFVCVGSQLLRHSIVGVKSPLK